MKAKPKGAKYRARRSGVKAAAKGRRLSDLVRIVGSASFDTHLAEILLERADRILTADGGRECTRVLTDVEIDLLLAGDEPDGRHMTGPAPERCGKPPPLFNVGSGVSAWRALGAGGSAEVVDAEPRRAYAAQGRAGEKREMGTGDLTIEQLKLVLGAEGWKVFIAEVAAARGRGRDVVVEKWFAVARTKEAEKLAEQIRAEAKSKAAE
ncbi:MAG TPA: hypothetical protein VKM54_21210 [Myxococcota bacterium]|nr:hypothetical protein [Myxococcota bacterium]